MLIYAFSHSVLFFLLGLAWFQYCWLLWNGGIWQTLLSKISLQGDLSTFLLIFLRDLSCVRGYLLPLPLPLVPLGSVFITRSAAPPGALHLSCIVLIFLFPSTL